MSSTGENHASMGPARQERPKEATARPHLGDRAQGRARAARADERCAHATARAAATARGCCRLAFKLTIKKY